MYFLESYPLKIETFLALVCITTYAYTYSPCYSMFQAVTPKRLLWEHGRPEMGELLVLDGEAVTVDLERGRERRNTNRSTTKPVHPLTTNMYCRKLTKADRAGRLLVCVVVPTWIEKVSPPGGSLAALS